MNIEDGKKQEALDDKENAQLFATIIFEMNEMKAELNELKINLMIERTAREELMSFDVDLEEFKALQVALALKEKHYDELLEATDQITANRNSLLTRVEETEFELAELKRIVWEYLQTDSKTVGGPAADKLKALHEAIGEPYGSKWLSAEEEMILLGWKKK